MSHILNGARPDQRATLTASLLATATLFGGLSTTAMAADLPTKAPQPTAYSWSGCYVGINAGAGASASNFNTNVGAGTYLTGGDPATVNGDGFGSANETVGTGGGQAGCNWQTNTIVVGIEGDFDYFRSNSNFSNNTDTLAAGTPFTIGQSVTTNYLATARPRIGIAADRSLAYITGGAAFTDATYTESYIDAAGGTGSASASKALVGWTAGAGWEYAWTDHWTFKVEYLYASFGTINALGVIAGPGGTNTLSGSGDLVIQTLRGGVNLKF